MILTHPLFERALISDGFGGSLLILEEPSMMTGLMKDLLAQLNGEDGSFILSEGGREHALEKFLHLLPSPLALEHNPRKALTTLYKQMDESLLSVEATQKLDELLSQMREFLLQVLTDSYAELAEPTLPEWDSILKFFEVSFQSRFSSMAEELNQYFKMMKHYCGIKVFVCPNLLSFISIDDLKGLFTEAAYNEYNILVVEHRWEEGQQPIGKQLIIMDKDQCEL
jgi:CRISPR type II-A-associated protein Csn2